ncbi:hypothetical protein BJY24_002384 [Nocardia transvalensis]|uniref:Uncharacterized protein n=1 Tax=Nocardia transvalensis TaxID=37333 RepID=A0A7W9UHW8_9NOCA|nr:hypothetical protein [Nocardia transvalensis]MBB5913517.1 hypothetical protein [Nocardia transvalensis]
MATRPAPIHYPKDVSIRDLTHWMLDQHHEWDSEPLFFGFAADPSGEMSITGGPLENKDTATSEMNPVHFRAARMKHTGSPLWGFGLVFEGYCEEFTPEETASGEMRRIILEGRLPDRPTAEEMVNAVIYDARGNEWVALTYRYLPERGISDLFTPAADFTKPPLGMAGYLWSAALLLDPANRLRVLEMVADDEDE